MQTFGAAQINHDKCSILIAVNMKPEASSNNGLHTSLVHVFLHKHIVYNKHTIIVSDNFKFIASISAIQLVNTVQDRKISKENNKLLTCTYYL